MSKQSKWIGAALLLATAFVVYLLVQVVTPSSAVEPAPTRQAVGRCMIGYANAPAQVCAVDGGWRYWFVSADGKSETEGPVIKSIDRLALLSSEQGVVRLGTVWKGENPYTGDPVSIVFSVRERALYFQTYCADGSEYEFVIDGNAHISGARNC